VVFQDDETLNIHRYADDGLHLNNDGIIALGNYLQGSVASLLDKKRIALPTPNPKANKTVSLK
jgi:lysophospholipase L1-like esterase